MVTELTLVLILLFVIVVPVAGIAFARSGRGYDEIGKGRFAVDFDQGSETGHREEVRQLVEAKAYRQARRGEQPVDIESEVQRLLQGEAVAGTDSANAEPPRDPEPDPIRDEIRQVVVAKNESRARRGEETLDVEAEVQRMLDEFG
jgi:hypothetical protein